MEAVTARMTTTAARLTARLAQPRRRPGPPRPEPASQRPATAPGTDPPARPAGPPSRLRSFDPGRLADLEYRAWTGYYLRDWPQVLAASAALIKMGPGMDWHRTLHSAWLALRAIQLWAPYPHNDPDGAQARMRHFYALIRLSYGTPASPAEAARLEIDWWRAHRQAQYATTPGHTSDELTESVTRLYSYLFSEPETAVRPAAAHRAHAMTLSDQWVREGRHPASPLLPLIRAALVRTYATLLAAVHH